MFLFKMLNEKELNRKRMGKLPLNSVMDLAKVESGAKIISVVHKILLDRTLY